MYTEYDGKPRGSLKGQSSLLCEEIAMQRMGGNRNGAERVGWHLSPSNLELSSCIGEKMLINLGYIVNIVLQVKWK